MSCCKRDIYCNHELENTIDKMLKKALQDWGMECRCNCLCKCHPHSKKLFWRCDHCDPDKTKSAPD